MWVGTLWRFRPSGEAHPERVDLRAVLEEVPDTWPELIPQVHQLPEPTQSVEGGVGLDGKTAVRKTHLDARRFRANPEGKALKHPPNGSGAIFPRTPTRKQSLSSVNLGDESHPGNTPPVKHPPIFLSYLLGNHNSSWMTRNTVTPHTSCLDFTSLIRRRAAGVSGV